MNNKLFEEVALLYALHPGRKNFYDYSFLLPYVYELDKEYDSKWPKETCRLLVNEKKVRWIFQKLAPHFQKQDHRIVKQWIIQIQRIFEHHIRIERALDRKGLIWKIRPDSITGYEYEFVEKPKH